MLQLYRSYWLDADGNKVYAHPGNKNFASTYAMIDNPWGVDGLFVTEGDNRTWHYRATDQVLGKLDLTHTVSKIHEIKTGIDVTQYSLSVYENSLPWDMNPFWDAYNYKPLVAAVYVQDRADFEDLVVRAGIRFDYLDSKAKVRAFPESLGARNDIADSLLAVPAKYRLAPRLGLSYPITERIKFRFSYGHFYKNPSFSDLYTYADRTAAELRSRGNVIVGNADMGAEKTIAYEMGFDAQLSDIFQFDVTAFYKDVFDLAGVRIVQALPQPYTMYYNVEYARIQGFEVTMTKVLNQYWSSRLGYTFQIAKGTASTADDAVPARDAACSSTTSSTRTSATRSTATWPSRSRPTSGSCRCVTSRCRACSATARERPTRRPTRRATRSGCRTRRGCRAPTRSTAASARTSRSPACRSRSPATSRTC